MKPNNTSSCTKNPSGQMNQYRRPVAMVLQIFMFMLINLNAFSMDIMISSDPVWNALNQGLNGEVYTIVTDGTDIYVGGNFTDAGGNPDADYIARWDGKNWLMVAPGMTGNVRAIAITDHDIYIGGFFTDAGGNPDADYIVRWDGETFHALGQGVNNFVFTIGISNGNIYAGGHFTDAGGNPDADQIAYFDGNDWQALGTGVTSKNNWGVNTISFDESNLYIGGDFTIVGGVEDTRGIARWDGASWHPLGQGFWGDMGVAAIVIKGSDIYVGGDGAPVGQFYCGIARFADDVWHPLGNGLSNCIYGEGALAITRDNEDIYVSGQFKNTGIPNTECIGRWDGTNWNAVGVPSLDPDNNWIFAQLILGDDIYVGGNFSQIGSTDGTVNIARWGEPETVSIAPESSTLANKKVKVLPNPSQNNIQFQFVGDIPESVKITITDVNGQNVLTTLTDHQEIDISQLVKGIYFLTLESSHWKEVEKIIKY